jgi:transcriptional regulator with XRE-family HTH domain
MENYVFYDNFIKLCNENKKIPSAVARDLGLSSAAVSKWKDGAVPRRTTIQKVADYFGVTYDSLFDESQEYVKVPTEKLEMAPHYINAIAEMLAVTGKGFDAASATEPQWREQLEKCNIEQLFSIQKMLTDVIQEKAIKNAKPE